MPSQHTHASTPFSEEKQDVIIICDRLRSPANIGALFRVADAFGVTAIYFIGSEIDLNSSRLKRTARNTEKNVPIAHVKDGEAILQQLKDAFYAIVALEITESSIPLQSFIKNPNEKIALLIGNERDGISDALLSHTDTEIHIEMYGKNSSMNVVQASGIALYAIIQATLGNR